MVLLDPDLVLVLSEHTDPRFYEGTVSTLRQALHGKVAVISGAQVLSNGPKILELVAAMRQEVLKARRGAYRGVPPRGTPPDSVGERRSYVIEGFRGGETSPSWGLGPAKTVPHLGKAL
jgi:hypothetical protein